MDGCGGERFCIEAGLSKSVSRARAEDFVVRVEGALVVCAGTKDYGVFARTLKDLRSSVSGEGHLTRIPLTDDVTIDAGVCDHC